MISNKKVLMIIVYICIMLGICACVMNSSGYNYESAKNHYNKGEYDKALRYIDKAIEQDEKAEYLILKANIEQGLDKIDEALSTIEKGISKGDSEVDRENNKQIYYLKTNMLLSQGKNLEALQSLEQAEKIKEYPILDKEIAKYKIDILVRSKKHKEALQEASKFISQYGDDGDVYRMMGDCGIYLGKKEEGMKCYDKAFDLGNNDVSYYKAEAYAYYKEYDKAIEEYEKCLTQTDNLSREDIYIRQISCMIKAKEYEKADNLIQQGLNMDNNKYKSAFVLSNIVLLEAKGEFDQAYVKAQEYLAEYGNDNSIKREIEFLKTRIVK